METELKFRKAEERDIPHIWEILQSAIKRRKKDGSLQWQDGYPNLQTVNEDVEKGYNYVLTLNDEVIATVAAIFNEEPTYEVIDGTWLSLGEFMVFHRLAISEKALGKGYIKKMFAFLEELALENHTFSIKADTNFDNPAMLALFEKCGYTYCGEIQVRDGKRKAFEKILKPKRNENE